MQQIPLPFRLDQGAKLDSYVPGPNQEVISYLHHFLNASDEPQLYLWCRESRGKTHLLQGLCYAASELGLRASYLPVNEIKHYGPELFQGLETMQLVCLDDIDGIVGEPRWDESLFHLINRCRDNGVRLAMSGHSAPNDFQVSLKDLSSRLHWGPIFYLKPLDELGLQRAVSQFAAARGMEMSTQVIQFLVQRYDRSIDAIIKALKLLDAEALSEQRKITIPFVKETLRL